VYSATPLDAENHESIWRWGQVHVGCFFLFSRPQSKI